MDLEWAVATAAAIPPPLLSSSTSAPFLIKTFVKCASRHEGNQPFLLTQFFTRPFITGESVTLQQGPLQVCGFVCVGGVRC